jgi:hypothetical protein
MRININWESALILICIVYTMLTIISSGYALLVGITTDLNFTPIYLLIAAGFLIRKKYRKSKK